MRTYLCSHAFTGAILLLLVGAAPVHAHTAVVAPDGSGDFTSIQAAIDDLFAHRTLGDPLVPPDTALVMAGFYDETIQTHVDGANTVLQLLCASGPVDTRVRQITHPPVALSSGHVANIDGLGVIQTVQAGTTTGAYWFTGCRFEGGFQMDPPDFRGEAPQFLRDCTFLAPSRLQVPGGVLGLRFVGARAEIAGQPGGPALLAQCRFEGPGDTLVVARPRGGQTLTFYRCTFQSAGVGITKALDSDDTVFADIWAELCAFQDLTHAAVAADWTGAGTRRLRGIVVQHSRITNCGRALEWKGGAGLVNMLEDTLQTTAAPGIRVASGQIDLVRMIGAPGTGGIQADLEYQFWSGIGEQPGTLQISECRMSGTPGPAIEVIDEVVGSHSVATLTQNTLTGSHGDGIRLSTRGLASITKNVITYARGAGVRVAVAGGTANCDVQSNTVVRNRGDGVSFVGDPDAIPLPRRVIRKNMSAENDGVGLRVGAGFPGSVGANNAWWNSSGNYADFAAPLDSNLSVYPEFCNLPAGDLHLKNRSACGTRGNYGLIGALSEACAATADAPGAAPLAFSLHPSPAHGAVAFTPPATGADGTIEVLDVAGRRVWSAPFRAGAPPIVWRGESSRGALDAGLYWARIVRPGESATRRLVWLK